MELTIKFDKKIAKVMQEKGNILTISRLDLQACCVPSGELITMYDPPEDDMNYSCIQKGKYHFYIQKGLHFRNNKVLLKTSGIKPFHFIRVDGYIRFV